MKRTVSWRWGATIKKRCNDCLDYRSHSSLDCAVLATSRSLICMERFPHGNWMSSWRRPMLYRLWIACAMRFLTSRRDCLIFGRFSLNILTPWFILVLPVTKYSAFCHAQAQSCPVADEFHFECYSFSSRTICFSRTYETVARCIDQLLR